MSVFRPDLQDDLTDKTNEPDDNDLVSPYEPDDNDELTDDTEAGWFDYFTLIVTRIGFAIHLAVASWKCAEYSGNNLYWGGYGIGLVIMIAETIYAVFVKKARGYKWVSPTILIYLYTILPMIWRLELYMLDERLAMKEKLDNEGTSGIAVVVNGQVTFTNNQTGSKMEVEREWVSSIEQIFIFTLIIGRWLLPKGEMTRDEVTRLLISYIGMSADIIGFFEAFTVFEVMYNVPMTYIILVSWSISALQFAFVLSAAKKVRIKQYTDDGEFHEPERENFGCGSLTGSYCCDAEVVGCLLVLFMQDVPFCILRLYMSAVLGATHYMHTFFIGKNLLVIIIMLYKMFGAKIDRGKKTDYDEIEE